MNITTTPKQSSFPELPEVPEDPSEWISESDGSRQPVTTGSLPKGLSGPAGPAMYALPSCAPVVPGVRNIQASKYRLNLVKARIVAAAEIATPEEFQKLRQFEVEAARLIDLASKSSPRAVIDQHKARRAELIADEGVKDSTFPANVYGPHGAPLPEKLKLAADRKQIIFEALHEMQGQFLPLCVNVMKKSATLARIELDRMLKTDRTLHDRFGMPYELESEPVRALASTIDAIESRSKSVIIGGWYGPSHLLQNVIQL